MYRACYRVCYRVKDSDFLVWSEKMGYSDACKHADKVYENTSIEWVDIVPANGIGKFLQSLED